MRHHRPLIARLSTGTYNKGGWCTSLSSRRPGRGSQQVSPLLPQHAQQELQELRRQHQQYRSHYRYSGPGSYDDSSTSSALESVWKDRDFKQRGFTVGIGGPVGSGKTALVLQLCHLLQQPQHHNHDDHDHNHTNPSLAVVTNDIFTQEDAEFLVKHNALSSDRIRAVETGGCPHAAIREDISANLSALEDLTHHVLSQQQQQRQRQQRKGDDSFIPLLLCESGGDNLAANFSRELADLTLYVIDVAGGDKVPRKGGPGITQSDMLIINKIDLASAVNADLNVMERDAQMMRGNGPTVFASVKQRVGLDQIQDFILHNYQKAVSLLATTGK